MAPRGREGGAVERRDAARQGSRGREDSRRHPEPGLAAEAAELELAQVPRARRRSHGSRRGRIWPLLQGRGRGRGPSPGPLRRGRSGSPWPPRPLQCEDDGGRPELEPRGAPARTRRGMSWPPPRPLLDLAAPGLGRSARWPPGATRSPRGHGRGGGPSPRLTSEEAWPDTPWAAPPPWIRLRAAREGERLAAAGRQRETESRGGGRDGRGERKEGENKREKKKKRKRK